MLGSRFQLEGGVYVFVVGFQLPEPAVGVLGIVLDSLKINSVPMPLVPVSPLSPFGPSSPFS